MSFAIYPLPAPQSGLLALCPLPGRSGDLPGDIATIAAFAPDIVVSLTESDELATLGLSSLPEDLTKAGLALALFPIRDFDVPDDTGNWAGLASRLHAILDGGGRVLVHCHGGKGRSGMIAMRLMVERGATPLAALTQLRAVRPGAVETDAQNLWASGDN